MCWNLALLAGSLTVSRRVMVALVALHVVLIATFALAALLEAPARGWAVLACVVAYNVALPLVARSVGADELVSLWAFLLPLSVWQVLPDWVLVDLLGTLNFPDAGGPRVADAVPLAMAGMWVAPLFITVVLARGSAWRGALFAVLVFTGSELAAPVLGVWEPTGVAREVAGVAVYVPPAEAVLGAATVVAWEWGRTRSRPAQIGAGLVVATLYLGALVLSYFVIDAQ